jgi:PhzF family phenazine biosynthesis protein
MKLKMFQVDAFTDSVFSGNPAGVVPLDQWIDESLMQNIAAENNLAETAFFVATDDLNSWHIRWFTPAVEVPLCGHATLASATIIRERLLHADWPINLQSASGPLSVDYRDGQYELDFPANPPQEQAAPDGLAEALGAAFETFFMAGDICLVTMPNEQSVAGLSPDFSALGKLMNHGIIVTAPGDTCDFVSRFFAPAIGIDEDPVTGAAHCVLTPYWSERLGINKLSARQISSRGGAVACEQRGDRVGLSGTSVIYLEGEVAV